MRTDADEAETDEAAEGVENDPDSDDFLIQKTMGWETEIPPDLKRAASIYKGKVKEEAAAKKETKRAKERVHEKMKEADVLAMQIVVDGNVKYLCREPEEKLVERSWEEMRKLHGLDTKNKPPRRRAKKSPKLSPDT